VQSCLRLGVFPQDPPRTRLRFGGALRFRTPYHPSEFGTRPLRGGEPENCAAASDFDIVGMSSQA